jgi:subtilisin
LAILLFTFGLFFLPSVSHAQGTNESRSVVYFKNGVDEAWLQDHTTKIVHRFHFIPAVSVVLKQETNTVKISSNESDPTIQISPDRLVETSSQSVSYGYNQVLANKRIPSTLSGSGVKIGVLDTGIDKEHPDLKVKGGTCVLTIIEASGCNNSYDDDSLVGHGTHVAGIIAAQNNTIGVLGVAPKVDLYAIKGLNKSGQGTTTTIMAGIEWAITNKMDILNFSLTTSFDDPALKAMVNKAYESGILLIAAAGNEGKETEIGVDTVQYPAKYDSVVAVSSTNELNKRAPTSSFGSEVEIAAPGEDIYSTFPLTLDSGNYPKGYNQLSGTSMAAPFATGIAALYMERYPNLSNKEIRAKLQKNAKDLGATGRDNYFGFGLVQADISYIDHSNITLPYTLDSKGKVNVDTSKILTETSLYNVYRFDKKIASDVTKNQILDYGFSGSVEYTFYAVNNGVEDRQSPWIFQVIIPKPMFKDVNNQMWYSRHLGYLYHEDILSGYKNKMIRPDDNITRAEAATLIGRQLNLSGVQNSTRFKDVTEKVTASGYIERLAKAGIISGFKDGTFRPTEYVTRAEISILIAKAFNLDPLEKGTFKDVTNNVTGYQYINSVTNENISKGYSKNIFKPYVTIKRAIFAVFLANAKNEYLR